MEQSTSNRAPAPANPAKKQDVVKSKDREKRDKLYEYCSKKKSHGEVFTIDELRKFDVADDEQELVSICQELVRRFLFVAMTLNRGFLYKTRSYATAKELAALSSDNLLAYTVIEGAGRTGIWRRPLETRTNLHPSNVTRALKELSTKKLIKEFKSAQTSRRTYITADVKPDERHLGGAFVEEGAFDTGLVDTLTMVAHNYILDAGWADQRPRTEAAKPVQPVQKPTNKRPAPSEDSTKRLNKPSIKAAGSRDDDAQEPPADSLDATALSDRAVFRESRKLNGKSAIPRHPTFNAYPTHMDVMVELNAQKVTRDRVLSDEDTRQLMAKLEFDGIVEHMRNSNGDLGDGFRTVKRVWKTAVINGSLQHFGHKEPDEHGWLPGNGASQVPCARCPVKSKCTPGGTVSPESCTYLGEWLSF